MIAQREPARAPAANSSCLYFGRVMHARLRPFRHRFAYRVFSIFVDLNELPILGRRLRLFSHNRWNLFSLYDRDFGPRDGGSLKVWIERHLTAAGIDLAGGRVRLLCFPRLFGYVFNPLSVWFCYDAEERLVAVLYDVSNTFGESHGYLLPVAPDRAPGQAIEQQCSKRLYVSPFMDMAATYRFRLDEPGERLAIRIDQEDAEGRGFVATHTARRAPLRDSTLLRACFAYPLMTLKVIGGIHWEALHLWRKGARLRPRPAPPPGDVTVAGSPSR
jgi:DUF1365 family protein